MQLSDLDLSNYLYNPSSNERVLRLINSYKEFQQDIKVNTTKVVMYIILMYDLNTELRNIYADYSTRKREAALIAGFNISKSGHFPIAVEDVLVGKNSTVNDMIIRYTMLFNNPDYLSLVAYTEMLIKEAKMSLSKDYRDTTITNITKLNKEIKALTMNIFGGDPSKNLVKALYKTMERERLRYRPETVAEDIQAGKTGIMSRPYDRENE